MVQLNYGNESSEHKAFHWAMAMILYALPGEAILVLSQLYPKNEA
jgi:hypothetical protein